MRTLFYLLTFFPLVSFAQQQPSAILHDDWTGSNWQQWGGTDYYYNSNGTENTNISRFYYGGNTWIDNERITSYYDISGEKITSRYFAQGIGTFPDTTTRILYEYNSFGQLTSETGQHYFPGYWKNDRRTVYSYFPGTGKVNVRQYEWWNNSLNEWIPISKMVFTHSSQQTQFIYYVWNGTEWYIEGRTIISFNPNDQPVEELNENWSGFYWTPGSKTLYTYNYFGKVSDMGLYYYSADEHDYQPGDSVHYTFNMDQSINSMTSMNYDNQAEVWSNIRRDRYAYNSQLAIEEEIETTLLVYPNPATDKITIQTSETGSLILTDVQGNILRILAQPGLVDISELAGGIYYIRLQTSKGIETKPFVKQ